VANYERVKAAWERALPRHSDSGEVLYHAGLCFEQNDPQRALALFKQARSMTSSDTQAQERYQQAIAVVYASAVTIDLKHGDSRYGINGIAMNAITVRTMLTELENSTDPALFSEVGSMVVQLTNDADSRFGLAFIQRAIDLDPSNSKWGEALESAKAEPIRRRNLGEILRDIRKRDQDNGTAAATIGGSQEEQATASANIVEGVQFSGESKVSEETLRGLIFTKKGEVYNDEAVHRDFVSLWNSGLFSDVHVDKEKGSHGGVLLRFVVVEHP
jgi:tetratricopeptide (TPR) repeat protein